MLRPSLVLEWLPLITTGVPLPPAEGGDVYDLKLSVVRPPPLTPSEFSLGVTFRVFSLSARQFLLLLRDGMIRLTDLHCDE